MGPFGVDERLMFSRITLFFLRNFSSQKWLIAGIQIRNISHFVIHLNSQSLDLPTTQKGLHMIQRENDLVSAFLACEIKSCKRTLT